MQSIRFLSRIVLSYACLSAWLLISLFASLAPKCHAENSSDIVLSKKLADRLVTEGANSVSTTSDLFGHQPNKSANGLLSAGAGNTGNQKHAPTLLTIADSLNIRILPYDDPLVVMLPLNENEAMITLKAVVNNSVISIDDKAAGDLYEFGWEILDMPAEAKQQMRMNFSESNKAWASLTNLVPGNYTVKLSITQRPNGTSVLPVNGSIALLSTIVQHALGDATKTIVAVKRTSYSSTVPRVNGSLLFSNQSTNAAPALLLTMPNHPPIAEISPAGTRQITKSGSPVVFADISKDTDANDTIVERKWSVLAAPAAYTGFPKNDSQNAALLTLENLPRGNYTFQLTVTDKHGATNSTTVRVNADYEDRAPVAFVFGDSVLHLSESNPETNRVTLDGSKSSDDNGIVSYEWTRGNHLDETLDIKGANKPVLTVSGFQHLGDYIFNLKVKDASNQADTHEFHVVVVKSDEDEPRAMVGDDLTVMAPVQLAILNGTLSKPKGKLSFMWTQAAGPSRVVIENADHPVANAKNFLVPGEYQFQLQVTHTNSSKKSEAKFKVLVNQGVNKAPVADAGPDRQVSLPFPVFSVNGSTSSDDLGIERYTWLMDDNNPAGATIVGNSQHESVLMLRGLVAGVHKFHLAVSDAQQLSSSASVTIEVLPDKFERERVELVTKPSLFALRQSNINDIEHALFLMLSHSDSESNHAEANVSLLRNSNNYYNVFIDAVETDRLGGNTRLIFHVVEHFVSVDAKTPTVGITDLTKAAPPNNATEEVRVADGTAIVQQLRQQFKRHHTKQLAGFDVLLVDTFVCRNPCSGHGECNNATKRCHCHMFWWPSPIRALIGDGQSNCDWSTFYVVLLGSILALLVLSGAYGFFSKQHLLRVKDFLLRTVNKLIAPNKSFGGGGGDNSGSDTNKRSGSQRPRRRRYRLLDNSSSPVNDVESNSVAVPRRSKGKNGIAAALNTSHNGYADAETSLEMTKRQYYSGHRQQQAGRQHRYRGAFNASYDDEDEDDNDESDSETLYDASSSRRLARPATVPQSTLIAIDEPTRQRVFSNDTSTTSGDIATFGSGGSSRNQQQLVSNGATRVATSLTQAAPSRPNNRNQSSSNLSGSYDSGMVLT